MVVRVRGRTFARIDVVLAFSLQLVGADDVTRTVGQRVDGNAFAIAAKAGAREMRQLLSGSRSIRVRLHRSGAASGHC